MSSTNLEFDCNSHDMPRLKKSLMLLGSFAFGFNASHAIHELGHDLATWATGGCVTGIRLHPFSWSKIFYEEPLASLLLVEWAGVVFASACGLLLLALIRRWQGAWTVPLAMTGLCTLVVNGLYLTIDCLSLAGGDATSIVSHGTPTPVCSPCRRRSDRSGTCCGASVASSNRCGGCRWHRRAHRHSGRGNRFLSGGHVRLPRLLEPGRNRSLARLCRGGSVDPGGRRCRLVVCREVVDSKVSIFLPDALVASRRRLSGRGGAPSLSRRSWHV